MTHPHDAVSTPSPWGGVDPRSEGVVAELDRIRRRFRELPLERAEAGQDLVRSAFGRLLPERMPPPPAIDPSTTVDQLRVLTFDACRRARADEPSRLDEILEVLVQVRRALP